MFYTRVDLFLFQKPRSPGLLNCYLAGKTKVAVALAWPTRSIEYRPKLQPFLAPLRRSGEENANESG